MLQYRVGFSGALRLEERVAFLLQGAPDAVASRLLVVHDQHGRTHLASDTLPVATGLPGWLTRSSPRRRWSALLPFRAGGFGRALGAVEPGRIRKLKGVDLV